MLRGQRFYMRIDTLGTISSHGQRVLVVIPKHAIVEVVSETLNSSRMIDVTWEGQAGMMFVEDLLEHGREITDSKPIVLSLGFAMIYVLRHSGCVGRLTSGRIEHDGSGGLNVYDEHTGEIIEYFSGTNIRSWCVFDPEGQRVEGWCEGTEEDFQRIFQFLSQH